MKPTSCPTCNSEAYELGSLGKSRYYRCQNCGIQFRITIKSDKRKTRERKQARQFKESKLKGD